MSERSLLSEGVIYLQAIRHLGGDSKGSAIHEYVARHCDGDRVYGSPHTYVNLARLVRAGFIAFDDHPRAHGEPTRTYRLTDQGRRSLDAR